MLSSTSHPSTNTSSSVDSTNRRPSAPVVLHRHSKIGADVLRAIRKRRCPGTARLLSLLSAVVLLVAIIGCDDSVDSDRGNVPQDVQNEASDSAEGVDPVVDGTAKDDRNLQDHSDRAPAASETVQGDTQPGIRLRQTANQHRLTHTYDNGASGRLLMVESTGGGVGWFDLDQDGLADVYCTQGGNPAIADESQNPGDAVFRQLPDATFALRSAVAGIVATSFGQGLSIGDFDNDGFPDVYVTNVGANRLYHNLGDGTFHELRDSTCVESRMWSSSAAWADVDRDGDLDLYVCNYLRYDPMDPAPCEKDGQPALCHPRLIDDWPDEYFENLGDGSFRSSARQKGLYGVGNKALGVAITDLTGDNWPDIYVANDTTRNFFFVNQKDGSFQESSLEFGGGLNAAGSMQASMGIAAGDFDRSGTTDLLLTHFTGESNTLYENLYGVGLFDVSGRTGLVPLTNSKLGFGTVMCDFNADGRTELFVANGHVDSEHASGDGYVQHAQLLSFDGNRWIDCAANSSDYFSELHVGRGVALGDFDADGDPDLIVAHQNEPLELLENESQRGNWLKIVPIPLISNRSGIGVSAIATVDGETWYSTIPGGTSFCASHEHAMFLGFGTATGKAEVRLLWPGGREQTLTEVDLNQILIVREK
jgi:enediyne biosynthesis protein E4